jgi:TetR/AcrR family transcriptional regulator, transcriptional repressor for nem operon
MSSFCREENQSGSSDGEHRDERDEARPSVCNLKDRRKAIQANDCGNGLLPPRETAARTPIAAKVRSLCFRSIDLEYLTTHPGWQHLPDGRGVNARMARPREFDEAAVLDAAVRCFWSRGYEATSVRELALSMGITGASLYNAFGDKRSLFRRALAHYVSQSFDDRVSRFEGKLSPLQAIKAFFAEIVERSLGDEDLKGCMLVNSALEVAPHDPEFQQVVAGVLVKIEAFFGRCVTAGQATGEISSAQPADDLARLLLGVLLGIRVLARARPEPELLIGLVRPVLAILDKHDQGLLTE